MSNNKCDCGSEAMPYKDESGRIKCEKCGRIINLADMVLDPPFDLVDGPEEPEHGL